MTHDCMGDPAARAGLSSQATEPQASRPSASIPVASPQDRLSELLDENDELHKLVETHQAPGAQMARTVWAQTRAAILRAYRLGLEEGAGRPASAVGFEAVREFMADGFVVVRREASEEMHEAFLRGLDEAGDGDKSEIYRRWVFNEALAAMYLNGISEVFCWFPAKEDDAPDATA